MTIAYVPPLTKDEYINAKADFRTIKESNDIVERVVSRSLYVFDKISQLLDLKYRWVTFDTVDLEKFDGKGNGSFDFNNYQELISFYSDIDDLEYRNKVIDIYFNKFPSRFIYEDFEAEVLNNIERIKQEIDRRKEKSARKRDADKKKSKERALIRDEVIASIKSKLTDLELSFIDFK